MKMFDFLSSGLGESEEDDKLLLLEIELVFFVTI